MSEIFQPVALEKFGLESRQKNIICTSSHSRPVKNSIKGTKHVSIKDKSHLTSKSMKPLIETLVEEFKALVYTSDEMEDRDVSILETLLAKQDSHSDANNMFNLT